jgi:glycosyltransferase involved in cell wall biosynthesis
MTTPPSTSERPLVTFSLVAYKQEKYVAEAVHGALAQTYSPLQVILSDDCSPDGTFEVMQRIAAEYRGPHTIILNRNPQNLNVARHVNAVERMAQGELLVAAAGDDISVPQRVQRLVETWISGGKKAGMIHSACTVITEDGRDVGPLQCPCLDDLTAVERAAARNAFVIGATEAWSPKLFSVFGPLLENLTHEDRALPFRSLLLDMPVVYVNEPLVKYRQGIGLSSTYVGKGRALDAAQRKQILERLLVDYEQKARDLRCAPNDDVAAIVQKNVKRYRVSRRFEDGTPSLPELLRLVRLVGVAHVARMGAKRLANRYRDRQ